MNELQTKRLVQAREAIDEAKALLEAGLDNRLVLTSVFYAYYYPVVALVHEGKVPDTMQSVTLGLFEQRFIQKGIFKNELNEVLRTIFGMKPDCSGQSKPVGSQDLKLFIGSAERFISDADRLMRA